MSVGVAISRFAPCVDGGVLPAVMVGESEQWVSTTSGRVARDGYSWMQAVHWVVASGCYMPRRSHGPREMNRTTVRVAQELAQLSPCRPGVEYLSRKLQVGERTVEYHLGMLREAGLLAYIERGTRVRGERAHASEFALVIPELFDACLGIRTAGVGVGRRMVGIAEAGRELMARLAAKAARKVRAARRKTVPKASSTAEAQAFDPATDESETPVSRAVSDASTGICRCTPMEGGCCTCLSDGSLHLPPESKLAGGKEHRATSQRQQEQTGTLRRRTLNKVGRRYQLAWELIQQVPWLNRAAVPRIAWVVREVADAGWTANEVVAWLDLREEPGRVRRPSAFLAARLTGAVELWTDPEGRERAVEAWRDSRRATAARHVEWDGAWQGPRSQHVRNLVAQALGTSKTIPLDMATDLESGFTLEDLAGEDIEQMRAAAKVDPALVWVAISLSGESAARRLYSDWLVDRALRLQSASPRLVVHSLGGQ